MKLPEGDLHPGPCTVVLTIRNHSSKGVEPEDLSNAQVREVAGRVVYDWRRSLMYPIAGTGITVDPGHSYTHTLTVEFPDTGVYDDVGSGAYTTEVATSWS